MRRRATRVAIFVAALAVGGCTVTGVAAPSGAAAHTGDSALQFEGEPGYNAP